MFLSTILLALIVGAIAGGGLPRLGDLRLRWTILLVAALGLRILAGLSRETGIGADIPVGWAYLGAYALIFAWLWQNWRVPGLQIAAVGIGANMAAVLLNAGQMPIWSAAFFAAGFTQAEIANDPFHFILTADTVGAYALSEAGSGSDAFALTTRAVEDGDSFVLSGRKLWITNANEAGIFIVFATLDPAAGYRGITAFVVEKDASGFTVGKKEDKLGIRASSTCELLFDDCRVPRSNLLGEPGKGYKVAIETLNEGRIGIGAQMIGLARGALDATVAYVKERKQFGKAIGEFQSVQHQIARAAVDVQAATLTVYNAARLRDAGKPFLTEAAICKIFSSEVAERVASLAVNLFGGNGFVKEYPVEKFYRDAKIGQIYEGTSNLQLQTIAKQLLG